MKRLLIALLLLITPVMALANWLYLPGPGYSRSIGATGPTQVASDDFNRSNGTLTTPWTNSTGFDFPLQISSQAVVSNTPGGQGLAVYTSETFSDNQYSEVVVQQAFNYLVGVVVRSNINAKSGYAFIRLSSDTAQIGGWNNGSWIGSIASCSGLDFTGGAVMRLEINGSSLVGKIDGVTTACAATDTTITTGRPGIFSGDNAIGIDNWAGGNL